MPCEPNRRLHVHDQHEFYFCATGGGQQLTSAGMFPMRSGELYLFPAGVAHIGNGAAHGRTVGIVINLRPEAYDDFAHGGDENRRILTALCALHPASRPLIALAPISRGPLRRICERLVVEFRERPPGFRAAVQALLHELLVLLVRDPRTGIELAPALAPVTGHEQLALPLRRCASEFQRPLRVADLARQAGLGRSRFHQVFKEVVGCGPTEYLNRLRIAEARRLLATSDQPLLDIALGVGFPSLSNFYAQFRRRVGRSPLSYRRQQRQGGEWVPRRKR